MPNESRLQHDDHVKSVCPLTPLQCGMLYHSIAESAPGVDIEQILCTVHEPLDLPSMRLAWHRVMERHAILRTAFQWSDVDQPRQIVHSTTPDIRWIDWRTFGAEGCRRRMEAFLRQDRARVFDLSQPPLMRVVVFECGADHFQLLWTFHHILLDGRSFPIVLRELFTFYDHFRAGSDVALPTPRPFSDYVIWLDRQTAARSHTYWEGLLRGFHERNHVDLGEFASPPTDGEYATERSLTTPDTRRLEAFAGRHGLTLNTIVQGAWALLLCHYSNTKDAVFGNTRACRHSAIAGCEDMVGLLINTVPVRVSTDRDTKLLQLLKDLRRQHLAVREHEHTSLAEIQQLSEVAPGQPLFDSLVVFDNYSLDEIMRAEGGRWRRCHFLYRGRTNLPLTLIGYGGERLLLRLEYDPHRYSTPAMEKMLQHLERLLLAMPAQADEPALRIPYLSEAERGVFANHDDATCQAAYECVHRSFERQARETPHAVALVFQEQEITYRQLNDRANALANQLLSICDAADALVGVYAERSPELIVGILAILKAGRGYVPVDPAWPAERVQFVLGDAGTSVVLTDGSVPPLPKFQGTAIRLDEFELAAARDSTNPVAGVTPEDVAYVIYTSGSTGQPKGCLVTHANVSRLFSATAEWFDFSSQDVWTLFHSPAFDFSVWEIWGALLYGGRLVIVPYWVSRAPDEFLKLLADQGVTILNQTPSAFYQLMEAEQNQQVELPSLRQVIFGGEALDLAKLKPWIDRHGDERPQLINMYGITETTVHVTYRRITESDVAAGRGSLIGVPIPDLQVYLLNEFLDFVPDGVVAEIFVGGAGVARGYLNRAELTSSRFVENPFQPGTRLYRSGDLARRLPDGDLEYLGRADSQVKLRGFRIELGEIEAVIRSNPHVKDAVVVVTHNATRESKTLVAYLTVAESVSTTEIRNFVAERLPTYMVPAHFLTLSAFPLTQNGKLDRRALPEPSDQGSHQSTTYVAPRSDTERALAAIWQHVLNVKRVGVHDSFFELGGDSILSIQIIAQARTAGLTITPQQIFCHRTIAGIASVAGRSDQSPSNNSPVIGDAPLTPIQRWFFEAKVPNSSHWNQAFLFRLKRSVDSEQLKQALREVILHHDALRLRFNQEDFQSRQRFGEPAVFSFKEYSLDDLTALEQDAAMTRLASETQASLEIANGKLVAAAYFRLGEQREDRLLLVAHHLATDGVSWRIVVEDLETAYQSLEDGKVAVLPRKTTSFKRWAEALAAYSESETLCKEQAYWQDVAAHSELTIPVDSSNGENDEASADTITVSLSNEATRALLQQAPRAYRTQINDLLLTALARALSHWCGTDRVAIDLEGHGREEIGAELDLSRTVGWFTTLFPVILETQPAAGVGDALIAVKEQLRCVPKKGIGHGVLRYLAKRELKPAVEPQVVFNYMGQLDWIVADSELFSFAPGQIGPLHDPAALRRHLLEIVAHVSDGRLSVCWNYSRHRHRRATIEALATRFLEELHSLIDHCCGQSKTRPTPSDFPLANLDQTALDLLAESAGRIEDVYRLTPMQQLFYSVHSASSDVGFEQWQFRLQGCVDPGALRRAWQEVINRHDILRTSFHGTCGSEPHQVVRGNVALSWTELDWRDSTAEQQAQRLSQLLVEDCSKGFDLDHAPIVRLTAARIAEDAWEMLWSTHHLLIDGWSWPLVLQDVATAYAAVVAGGRAQWTPPPRFRDYLLWLDQRDVQQDRDYWKSVLNGVSQPTPLSGASGPTHADTSGPPTEVEQCLPAELTSGLRELARQTQVTDGIVFQAIWALLLGAVHDRTDVVFGAAFSGRPAELPGAGQLVGPLVNNVPVRVQWDADTRLTDLLHQIQQSQLETQTHQYLPLVEIQATTEMPARERMFNSLVVFQNYVVGDSAVRWTDAVSVKTVSAPQATKYPLTLVGLPGNSLSLKLLLERGRFAVGTEQAILADFRQLAERIIDQPHASTAELCHGRWRWATVRAEGDKPPSKRQFAAPQSTMERVIFSVWQEAFATDRIGRYDNFFELGGHSVMLVTLHRRLEEELGRSFPITSLFQFPTIQTLAAYLGEKIDRKETYRQVQGRAERARAARARRRSLQRIGDNIQDERGG